MPIFLTSQSFAGRFPRFDAQAFTELFKRSSQLWLVLPILFVTGVIGLASAGFAVYRDSKALNVAMAAAEAHANAVVAATMPRPSSNEGDFASELPLTPPTDLQIRFAAKLARAQDVVVVQMQAEPFKSNAGALGQSRITMQLRGDYRDIKSVWIAMLSKFPGLTLQRLTIRHHADAAPAPSPAITTTALPPADRADDDASVEMIQYTRVSATVR